jgi:hypothetical protein
MKKLLLILVLGVFAFGASGFGTIQQNDPDNPSADCLDAAWDAGTAAVNSGLYNSGRFTKKQIAHAVMEIYIDENC